MRLIRLALPLALMTLPAACHLFPPEPDAEALAPVATETVRGEITYRARIALVPGSTATVTLNDVSRMDAPATRIASATVAARRPALIQ